MCVLFMALKHCLTCILFVNCRILIKIIFSCGLKLPIFLCVFSKTESEQCAFESHKSCLFLCSYL